MNTISLPFLIMVKYTSHLSFFKLSVKPIVGAAFNTFLNSVRIRKAEEIIKSPEGSKKKITDIIYECGFTSPFTYYRHRKAPNNNPTKT